MLESIKQEAENVIAVRKILGLSFGDIKSKALKKAMAMGTNKDGYQPRVESGPIKDRGGVGMYGQC